MNDQPPQPPYAPCAYDNGAATRENVRGIIEAAMKSTVVDRYDQGTCRYQIEKAVIPPNGIQCQPDQHGYQCKVMIKSLIVESTCRAVKADINLPTSVYKVEYRFSWIKVDLTASYEIDPPYYLLSIQPNPGSGESGEKCNGKALGSCLRCLSIAMPFKCADLLIRRFIENQPSCRITSTGADFYI